MIGLISAPEQWTSIPVLVKIYKLLINELSNQIECNTSTRGMRGDEDEDDDVSRFRFSAFSLKYRCVLPTQRISL